MRIAALPFKYKSKPVFMLDHGLKKYTIDFMFRDVMCACSILSLRTLIFSAAASKSGTV